jgi:hypothetical protein
MTSHFLMIDEEHFLLAELGSIPYELINLLKEESKKIDLDILPFFFPSEMIFNILQLEVIKSEILKLQLKNLIQKDENLSIFMRAIETVIDQKSYIYLKIIIRR